MVKGYHYMYKYLFLHSKKCPTKFNVHLVGEIPKSLTEKGENLSDTGELRRMGNKHHFSMFI